MGSNPKVVSLQNRSNFDLPLMPVPLDSEILATVIMLSSRLSPARRHGAMAARLTPDQKVGSSNLSAVFFVALLFRSIDQDRTQVP